MAGAARVMIVGTGLSRITGFVRILALAYILGSNRLSDAYNLANTTPNIIFDLVVGGVLSGTLVPVFVQAVRRENSEDEDWDAVSAVCTVVGVVLAVLTVLLFLTVPLLIRVYTVGLKDPSSAAERHLAVELLYLFVPQVAFYGAVTLMTAVLNARRRFTAPAFAPVLNNLLVIVAILITRALVAGPISVEAVLHNSAAKFVLGIGTTAGVVAMAAALIGSLRSAAPQLRWNWRPRHPAIRTVVALSGWTAGFVVANQVNFFVIVFLANRHPGELTAWTYAYVLFLLPHGVFAVSVMSAVEPELAQRWSIGDIVGYHRQLVSGVRLVAAIIIPAALGYAALSRPVVRLLLHHSAFSSGAAQTTADVLSLMALGLPVFSVYQLLMRAYQAMQDTRTMFFTYLVENLVNIVLALILWPFFGVRGLAAAWSLAYGAGTLLAIQGIRVRIGAFGGRQLGEALYRITCASVVAIDMALLTSIVLARVFGTGSELFLFVRVLAIVIVGVTVYMQVARIFRIDEVRSLLHPRRHPA